MYASFCNRAGDIRDGLQPKDFTDLDALFNYAHWERKRFLETRTKCYMENTALFTALRADIILAFAAALMSIRQELSQAVQTSALVSDIEPTFSDSMTG